MSNHANINHIHDQIHWDPLVDAFTDMPNEEALELAGDGLDPILPNNFAMAIDFDIDMGDTVTPGTGCLWCFAGADEPHTPTCSFVDGSWANLPNQYEGVDTYGTAQGLMASPTRPSGPVRLQSVAFGQQPPAHPVLTPMAAPAFATPPAASDFASPSTAAEQPATIPYAAHFATFEAAQAALRPAENADPTVRLDIANDDYEFVKTPQALHTYAARILAAIQHPPDAAPAILLDDFQKAYFFDHQSSTLAGIVEELRAGTERSEARILVMLQELISIHELGLPRSLLARTTAKDGYRPDTSLTCSQRVGKVIDAAARDKYVAHDILCGHRIQDLVRSPVQYLRRKQENARVNAKKAYDKRLHDRQMGKSRRRQYPSARREKMAGKRGLGKKGAGGKPTELQPQMALPDHHALPRTPDTPGNPVAAGEGQRASGEDTGVMMERMGGTGEGA